MPPEVAYIMMSIMRSVIDEGTARAARRQAAPPGRRQDRHDQ